MKHLNCKDILSFPNIIAVILHEHFQTLHEFTTINSVRMNVDNESEVLFYFETFSGFLFFLFQTLFLCKLKHEILTAKLYSTVSISLKIQKLTLQLDCNYGYAA